MAVLLFLCNCVCDVLCDLNVFLKNRKMVKSKCLSVNKVKDHRDIQGDIKIILQEEERLHSSSLLIIIFYLLLFVVQLSTDYIVE